MEERPVEQHTEPWWRENPRDTGGPGLIDLVGAHDLCVREPQEDHGVCTSECWQEVRVEVPHEHTRLWRSPPLVLIMLALSKRGGLPKVPIGTLEYQGTYCMFLVFGF